MLSKGALLAMVIIGSILGFLILLFIVVTLSTCIILRAIDKGLNGPGPENSLWEFIKLWFRRVCPTSGRRRRRRNRRTQIPTGEPTAMQILQIATANRLNAVTNPITPAGTLPIANNGGTQNHGNPSVVRVHSPMMPVPTPAYHPPLQVIQPASATLPLALPLLSVTPPLSVTRQSYHPSMYGRIRSRQGMVYLPVRYGPGSVYQMETYTSEDLRRIAAGGHTPRYIAAATGHEHGHGLRRSYTMDGHDEDSEIRRIHILQGGPAPAYEASPPPPPPVFSPAPPSPQA